MGNNNNSMQMLNQFQLNPELIYSSTFAPTPSNTATLNNNSTMKSGSSTSLATPIQSNIQQQISYVGGGNIAPSNTTTATTTASTNPMIPPTAPQQQHQQQNNLNQSLNNNQVSFSLSNFSSLPLPQQQPNIACLDGTTTTATTNTTRPQHINYDTCIGTPILNNTNTTKSNNNQQQQALQCQSSSSSTPIMQQQQYPWNNFMLQQTQQYYQKISNNATTATNN